MMKNSTDPSTTSRHSLCIYDTQEALCLFNLRSVHLQSTFRYVCMLMHITFVPDNVAFQTFKAFQVGSHSRLIDKREGCEFGRTCSPEGEVLPDPRDF